MGPTKKTPAGRSFVHVRPPALTSCLFSFSTPHSSSPPSLNEHSYAFDRVDELRTYLLLLLPSDYLLCCVPAPLLLLFTNIVSSRDKLLNKWGLPTAPAHRTTRTVLLHTTRTTKTTTLLQHPITCQPDSRCDYWAAWTSQCIRKFYHLLSLGYFLGRADNYIDRVPPTAPTTQTTNSRNSSQQLATARQVHPRVISIPRLGTYPRTRRSPATAGPTRHLDTMHPRVQTPAGLAHSMRLRTPLPALPSRG